VADGTNVTPAAEWLLDNYHLVEVQIREVLHDLPTGFYRQLPKLVTGPLAGYPRVFGIAWAFVAHTDSRLDADILCRFLEAYQRVQLLTIGELWAVAITLRVVLVENLRRSVVRTLRARTARDEADAMADRLLGANGQIREPDALLSRAPSSQADSSFRAQLIQRLRDQDPRVTPALQWLDDHLHAAGTSADEVVSEEHQRQGASNVTVRSIITSMRLISDIDWASLFERVSLVDRELRLHSGYVGMDFSTRNQYRSAIESLARRSKFTEVEIARAATRPASDPPVPEDDPGFRLIGDDREAFAAAIGYSSTAAQSLRNWVLQNGAASYVTLIGLVAMLALGVASNELFVQGVAAEAILVLVLLGAIPSLDIAVALVNRLAVRHLGTNRLPGLALRDGVPVQLRTLVVVPVLLRDAESAARYIDRLEVHFLASPPGALHFALLTDWCDAEVECLPGDEEIVAVAASLIAQLNLKYPQESDGIRFHLLHRKRRWSATQQAWIGWERKRGKLHELNRWLRGASDTSFGSRAWTPAAVPPGIRFVVTLDADTRLPRDALRLLIGKMAHPLNHARVDGVTGRIVSGYAILQPRVTPSLPLSREGTIYQRVHSSPAGIDPYAAASSDVYQDLSGEGSYTGKGIYDIDAFEAALEGRIPEETLLSHDLFEGTFARAGLASDVAVVEDFPARYDVAARRQHRWIRGDWQLLPWILGGTGRGRMEAAGLSLMSRWKMIDNLRRSLSAPASVASLAAAWVLPVHAAVMWTGFILLAFVMPAVLPVLGELRAIDDDVTARSHGRVLRRELTAAIQRFVLGVAFLPHQAASALDAILRTLVRVYYSRAKLLEWATAERVEASARLSIRESYAYMGSGPAATLIFAIAVAIALRRVPWLAAPFVLLWGLSPLIAFAISREDQLARQSVVGPLESEALGRIARATWRYFETFVVAEDHWLPPDNFQDDPRPVVAHRTSPTNIGLYLLAAVSARDLGWIGEADAAARVAATLTSMGRMQRYRGHFYNWYDTLDLRPLEPRYVSTVDSGNLAAHLIALANTFEQWADGADRHVPPASGIADAASLARTFLRALPEGAEGYERLKGECEAALRQVLEGSEGPAAAVALDGATAEKLSVPTEVAADLAKTLALDSPADANGLLEGLAYWTEAAAQSCRARVQDLKASVAARAVLVTSLLDSAAKARSMAASMDFSCLINSERRLLSIGLRVSDGSLDPGCYDLLASEARLASFFAIAKRDAPARYWFRLGRESAPIGRGAALLSWSGSMFEYLMPTLVMREPPGSLLAQTCLSMVERQIQYGAERGVPWGISESAYNARDVELTYQYSNFGVPGLGLKRGLRDDLVVAPYATALAAMVDPVAAVANFRRLDGLGAFGRYGFFESIDFTRKRLPDGSTGAVVHAFMAHHQGMTIVAIANALLGGRMPARFHSDPEIEATELLLQERPPRYVTEFRAPAEGTPGNARSTSERSAQVRRFKSPHDASPQTHLLSNGHYSVMITAVGSGYTRWNDFAVTRWVEDGTRDDQGSYVFLRDLASGAVWSASFQPRGVEPDSFDVAFSEDRAVLVRKDGTLECTTEVLVSPECDADVRRLSFVNHGYRSREIEFTTYSELALAPPAADLAHPAFLKLFVNTEFLRGDGALLATRRLRSPEESAIWVAQQVVVEGAPLGPLEIETDRARFIGRGRDLRTAVAMQDRGALSDTVGTVLDPVFCFRQTLRIPPAGRVTLALWTVVADSRAGVLDLLDKHRERNAFARVSTLAWTQAQVQLRHLGVEAAEAALFQRLAGHLLYGNSAMRPASEAIRRGLAPPGAIWTVGISGDLPIILLRVTNLDDLGIARQLLRAHEYWRTKHFAVDLVIVNARGSSYVQDLEVALETAVRMSQSRPRIGGDGARGSVFVLRADLISKEADGLLRSVSRVVLHAARGPLEDQLDRARMPFAKPRLGLRADVARRRAVVAAPVPTDLEFFNGIGGFGDEGREYVTVLGGGQHTPLPWINVIANPSFGFHVSAEGSSSTWSQNGSEFRLTPWSNDPVSDRSGEAIYLRDEETGELWGPSASPVRDGGGHYRVTHGQGYSRFQHSSHGIRVDLVQFVPRLDSVKVSRLHLTNETRRARSLSVTVYHEWVLGASRSRTASSVVTEIDAETGALFAQNAWHGEFGSRVAFSDLRGTQRHWTADREEFLGRHGCLAEPAGLLNAASLSGRVGAGLDPCSALQAHVHLGVGESVEIVALFGDANSADGARELIKRYRTTDLDESLADIKTYWNDLLGAVQVTTPDRGFDIMFNRWALYQVVTCRLWARSAFYQSSGAYGFRDQLQDAMAIAAIRPEMAREHLLRASSRQFPEGDVQHWWHPNSGQGVRTRISDDSVWLAHAISHYVATTGDRDLLETTTPFLSGRRLEPGESDAYFRPETSDVRASVYEHGARALDQSLEVGAHGLPLMGTGDWNDGMNLVGASGRGESVWLGWLLYATLASYSQLARERGESARLQRWADRMESLTSALDEAGWDGAWYRRGYYDDGSPLGAANSGECEIDAIAQSWSVISGAGKGNRPSEAMNSLDRRLLDRGAGLALLFAPPFDRSVRNPGYVKGYPPGIRENGGQYSHAAGWTALAFAMAGDGDRALEVLSMINPISRGNSRADLYRYKVEPYVIAADIYSRPPHVGRGGWTWYTGAAGVAHRAAMEGILGIRRRGNRLHVNPTLPRSWPRADVTLTLGASIYVIAIESTAGEGHGVIAVEFDGLSLPINDDGIPYIDDGRHHMLKIRLGTKSAS
jgi:cyclic beta-1,2-glucan synthetase